MDVIFVGSFAGIKGGVGLACKMVLDNPHLRRVRWTKICSAMRSLPPPGVLVRSVFALRRLLLFLAAIAGTAPRRVLIFSSAGGSFLEKGLMAVLASHMGHAVTFCPRSGYLLDDLGRSRGWRWFTRVVFAQVDRVVCQGEEWRRHFSPYARPGQLVVIPNMLDCPEHLRLPPAPGSPGPRAVFAMFGWMERNKGIYDLLEIVDRRREAYAGCEFHVCGEGSCLEDFRREVSRRGLDGMIRVPGWVDGADKVELLRRTHVVLVLSYREGLPNVLLEAMAAGRAVVATRVGAIPDVVAHGETALLCEAGDREAFHAAMQRLMAEPDLRHALGSSARRAFVANHGLDGAGRRWLEVLGAPAD